MSILALAFIYLLLVYYRFSYFILLVRCIILFVYYVYCFIDFEQNTGGVVVGICVSLTATAWSWELLSFALGIRNEANYLSVEFYSDVL